MRALRLRSVGMSCKEGVPGLTTPRKITMAELARLANVDVSTVSRALSGSPLVKEDTKAEILKIAAEWGYAVNASARNLRRQSAEAIGLVIPLRPGSGQTISDPFYLEMVAAVSEAASRRGYDLIVSVPKGNEQIAEQRLLRTGKADGLIIIGQAGLKHTLDALGPLARKVVVWGGQSEGVTYTLVGSDNREGGRLAAEHLFSAGRTRTLFMGPLGLPEVRLRLEGFDQARRALGLSVEPGLRLDVEFGGTSGFQELGEMLDGGVVFDSIFAASDVLAMTAVMALQARGLQVPADVAVMGYDNIGQSRLCSPALTTIDQNIPAGGELLVDLLLRQLNGEDVKSQLTPTQLIVRASTGKR